MSRMLRAITISAAVLAVVAPVLAQPSMQPSMRPGPIATEQVGGTILTVAPTISYEKALLRVSGPDGYALSKVFTEGGITADLLASAEPLVQGQGAQAIAERLILADGRYKYEVVFTGANEKTQSFTGMFFVEGGSAVSREAKRSELADVRGDLAGAGESSGGGYTETTNVDDILQIFDTNDNDSTHIFLEGGAVPPASNWHIRNDLGDIIFREYPDFTGVERFTIEQGGQVGIGTTAPAQQFHIVSPSTRMQRFEIGSYQFDFGMGGTGLWFYDDGNQAIAKFNHAAPSNSLVLGANGVGIGTPSPAEDLHVRRDDPQIFVQSTGVAGTSRVLFKLENEGKIRFSMNNTAAGKIWTFDNDGRFTVSRVGTGVNEFTFFDTGNLTILGTLTQNSDRNTKEDITAVDPAEVLAKVGTLPIATWRKIGDRATHLGPMAQDFSATFGLGENERTIAPVDLAGVSLAAIQALKAENEALKSRLADLEEAVAALAEH